MYYLGYEKIYDFFGRPTVVWGVLQINSNRAIRQYVRVRFLILVLLPFDPAGLLFYNFEDKDFHDIPYFLLISANIMPTNIDTIS